MFITVRASRISIVPDASPKRTRSVYPATPTRPAEFAELALVGSEDS